MIAEVLVDIRTRALDKVFDYDVPEPFERLIRIGHRVYLSFGNQYIQGFVVGLHDAPSLPGTRKPILDLLDDRPILSEEMLRLADWMSERYVCTRLEAILAMVPAAFRVHQVRRYRASELVLPDEFGPNERQLWQALNSRELSYNQIQSRFGELAPFTLSRLLAGGWAIEVVSLEDRAGSKEQVWIERLASVDDLRIECAKRARRAPKQAKILESLMDCDRRPIQEIGLRPSDTAIQALVRDGLVHCVHEEVYREPAASIGLIEQTHNHTLTSYQELALRQLQKGMQQGGPRSVVLHGVTGSGKTEVYLRAIQTALDMSGGAIVLVPEIALTPQMVGRFTARFGRNIAVLHSGLSNGEKRDEWLRVKRGEVRIVVGARSAVFAPVEGLKLIIVDEEHEPTFKQDESPRYDAREIARWRAAENGGIAVFGSATPSLQMMHEVECGRATVVSLPVRANGKPLPPVEVVDMREELRAGNRSLFSRVLQHGLEQAIGSGGQAILFLNRRGFAAFLLCRSCGEMVDCPHCDISLTMHKTRSNQALRCHYCDYATEVPDVCPHCGEDALRPFGFGTQQVEQAIEETWPNWRVLRMDVDTTRRKGAHQEAIQRFYDGETDILLGTQMIAKGLDFPNVTFVGVMTADTMLAVPDYRASERTFSLLTQVAGRAGRAERPGRTVVQTYCPEHYAISTAANHDYASFYHQERAVREMFHYPPFCEITLFMAQHASETVARGAAARFEREVSRKLQTGEATVLPAVPAGVARVEDQYRFQVVLKYKRWIAVREVVRDAFQLVYERMRKLDGTCMLDVNAGRF